jgi:hypothetical protein
VSSNSLAALTCWEIFFAAHPSLVVGPEKGKCK